MAASWSGYGPSAQLRSQDVLQSTSKKKPQPRQLLSCTKCRERKVKVSYLSRSNSIADNNSAIEPSPAQLAVPEVIQKNVNLLLEKVMTTVQFSNRMRSENYASRCRDFVNVFRLPSSTRLATTATKMSPPIVQHRKHQHALLRHVSVVSRQAIDQRTCISVLQVTRASSAM